MTIPRFDLGPRRPSIGERFSNAFGKGLELYDQFEKKQKVIREYDEENVAGDLLGINLRGYRDKLTRQQFIANKLKADDEQRTADLKGYRSKHQIENQANDDVELSEKGINVKGIRDVAARKEVTKSTLNPIGSKNKAPLTEHQQMLRNEEDAQWKKEGLDLTQIHDPDARNKKIDEFIEVGKEKRAKEDRGYLSPTEKENMSKENAAIFKLSGYDMTGILDVKMRQEIVNYFTNPPSKNNKYPTTPKEIEFYKAENASILEKYGVNLEGIYDPDIRHKLIAHGMEKELIEFKEKKETEAYDRMPKLNETQQQFQQPPQQQQEEPQQQQPQQQQPEFDLQQYMQQPEQQQRRRPNMQQLMEQSTQKKPQFNLLQQPPQQPQQPQQQQYMQQPQQPQQPQQFQQPPQQQQEEPQQQQPQYNLANRQKYPSDDIVRTAMKYPQVANQMSTHNDQVDEMNRFDAEQASKKAKEERDYKDKDREYKDKINKEDRDYNTSFSRADVEENDRRIASKGPMQRAIRYMEDAIKSGDTSAFTLSNLSEKTGLPGLQTLAGAQLKAATTDYYISTLDFIGKNSKNKFYSLQSDITMPQLGKSDIANEALTVMTKSNADMNEVLTKNFNIISKKENAELGFEKKGINNRAIEASEEEHQQIFQGTLYQLQELREREMGLNKMEEKVGKRVTKGTPLTPVMAKLYFKKYGLKNAEIIAKKNGYFVPTPREYQSFKR